MPSILQSRSRRALGRYAELQPRRDWNALHGHTTICDRHRAHARNSGQKKTPAVLNEAARSEGWAVCGYGETGSTGPACRSCSECRAAWPYQARVCCQVQNGRAFQAVCLSRLRATTELAQTSRCCNTRDRDTRPRKDPLTLWQAQLGVSQ